MSKHKKLTVEDVQNKELNKELLRLLDEYCEKNNLEKKQIRILDFGSGRGATVLRLRIEGFDVYGVDIDSEPINNGIGLFRHYGFDGNKLIKQIAPDCKTPFDDEFFDVVISDQVVEHAKHINLFFREIKRITKKGGFNLHLFPHHLKYIEAHLYMPFIQMVPKSFLRFLAIWYFTRIGREPRWPELSGLNPLKKAKVYFRYSIKKTFYRPDRVYKRIHRRLKYRHMEIKHQRNSSFRLTRLSSWFPYSSQIYAVK